MNSETVKTRTVIGTQSFYISKVDQLKWVKFISLKSLSIPHDGTSSVIAGSVQYLPDLIFLTTVCME